MNKHNETTTKQNPSKHPHAVVDSIFHMSYTLSRRLHGCRPGPDAHGRKHYHLSVQPRSEEVSSGLLGLLHRQALSGLVSCARPAVTLFYIFSIRRYTAQRCSSSYACLHFPQHMPICLACLSDTETSTADHLVLLE